LIAFSDAGFADRRSWRWAAISRIIGPSEEEHTEETVAADDEHTRDRHDGEIGPKVEGGRT
jgi:hypothetical protein